MQTRSSKRRASPPPQSPPKRVRTSRLTDLDDVTVIEDSDDDDDPELKGILAQIKAQEESENLAKRLQRDFDQPIASGSKSMPIDVDGDAALAKRLAEEWANEGPMLMETDGVSSDVEILPDPIYCSSEPTSKSEYTTSLDKQATGSSRDDYARASANTTSNKVGRQTFTDSSITPDEALGPFRDIFTRTRDCSKCKKKVKSPRGCVTFSDSLLPPSLTFLLHAPCTSCRTNHCRGCFQAINCPASCKGPSKNAKCTILNCCAELRAIAIFEALGGLDRQFILEQAASVARASANVKNPVKGQTVGPGGTGYGRDGYVPNVPQPISRHKKPGVENTISQPKAAAHWEKNVVRAMNLLIKLLPAPYSDSPQVYDMLPHASIGHLILLSQIPTVLATLLRNDSVTDWISRKETYNTMLSLLRRMGDCELTIRCLIGERWETASTCGIEEWMWEDGEIIWIQSRTGEPEIAYPLYTYFKKLTKQSEAFQAGAMQMLGEGDTEADVEETMIQGTSLCGDIIAARDDLERAIAILGQPEPTKIDRDIRPSKANKISKQSRSKKGKSSTVAINIDQVYVESCENLAFKHVSMAEKTIGSHAGLKYSNFNYADELTRTQSATRHPRDRLHLLKELAVTATSLPPGVWVRVDDVRNDAIKIMIAGPDDTPYAGGLFEFDCFLPIEYPNKPPLMHLRTTGGGSVRFNPNLYNTGKVCLSLLGTWPGRPEEQWSPKSTLLQVLVSIQSMILIDAPYYNEPGHGQANLKASVSIEYNKDISVKTVRWAIVDWLKNEHRDGIWRDVIASHFVIRKDKIRQKIVEWARVAPQIQSYTGSSSFNQFAHAYTPLAKPTQKGPNNIGLDLIEEFDKGVKTIECWKIGDGAE